LSARQEGVLNFKTQAQLAFLNAHKVEFADMQLPGTRDNKLGGVGHYIEEAISSGESSKTDHEVS